MYEKWDIYTQRQYNQFKSAAEKEYLLDPKKREKYFKMKAEQEKMDKLVREYERKRLHLY